MPQPLADIIIDDAIFDSQQEADIRYILSRCDDHVEAAIVAMLRTTQISPISLLLPTTNAVILWQYLAPHGSPLHPIQLIDSIRESLGHPGWDVESLLVVMTSL